MENGYYENRLTDAGLTVVIPDAADREIVQQHQSRAASGQPDADAKAVFAQLLSRYADCDAAVLGCTELPELIEAATAPMTLLDPLAIQCDAAFRFAIEQTA